MKIQNQLNDHQLPGLLTFQATQREQVLPALVRLQPALLLIATTRAKVNNGIGQDIRIMAHSTISPIAAGATMEASGMITIGDHHHRGIHLRDLIPACHS